MEEAPAVLKTPRGRLLYAVIVIAVLYVLFNLQMVLVKIPAYRNLYHGHPFYVPESLKAVVQIVLCLAITALYLGRRSGEILSELGLNRGFSKGLLFGFFATLPFLIGLAVTHRVGKVTLPAIFLLAFLAPFSEELVVRAYGFGQLYRRCGWPLWPAIAVTAAIFGWGHVEKGSDMGEAAALFLLTGIAGAVIAWCYYRWNSIWFPWTVHVLMNLYWEIFSVSRTALGGWFPFALQWATLIVVVVMTARVTRRAAALSASV